MSLVLVTGISGYLASYLVNELLIAGYRVRGTVRGGKLALVREGYATSPYKDRLEIVQVEDIVDGDFTEALKGVVAVIHTASPVFKGTAAEEITIAEKGTMNVVKQAEKAGIKKIVFTSSMSTALNPDGQWSSETWNPIPKEQVLADKSDWFSAYMVSKTEAEKAFWRFADEHPHVDMTSINPHLIYGKFAPGFRAERGNKNAWSTNEWIYRFLSPDGQFPIHGGCADIVDVARAHVLALTAPPTSEVGRKRILMSTEWFHYSEVVEYIAKVRPHLKPRLLDGRKARKTQMLGNIVDASRCKEVLGLEMRDWRDTIIDAVDAVLDAERQWAGPPIANYKKVTDALRVATHAYSMLALLLSCTLGMTIVTFIL